MGATRTTRRSSKVLLARRTRCDVSFVLCIIVDVSCMFMSDVAVPRVRYLNESAEHANAQKKDVVSANLCFPHIATLQRSIQAVIGLRPLQ